MSLCTLNSIFSTSVDLDAPAFSLLKTDALVASCVAWRFRQVTPMQHIDFLDPDTELDITESDIKMAESIRSYYGKKLFIQQLENKPMSRFRKDLLDLLHQEDCKKVNQQQRGMIYLLPEFYQADCALNKIKQDRVTVFTDTAKKKSTTFTPVELIKSKSSKKSKFTFWLETEDNRLAAIEPDSLNPLLHIFVDIFVKSAKLKIHSNLVPIKRDRFSYYKVESWKLEEHVSL